MSANQNTPRSEADQGRIAVTPGKTLEERRANFTRMLAGFVAEAIPEKNGQSMADEARARDMAQRPGMATAGTKHPVQFEVVRDPDAENRRIRFANRLTEFVRENRGPTETDNGAGDSR